jgi:hypothetical protein
MLFMLLGVEIEEHCSTEDKPAMEKDNNLQRMIRHNPKWVMLHEK